MFFIGDSCTLCYLQYEYYHRQHPELTLFKFHDEFIEVLAKGFWFEKSEKSLKNKPLQESHPCLPLTRNIKEVFNVEGVNYFILKTQIDTKTLSENAFFYEQKLVEIHLELDKKYSLYKTLYLQRRNNKLISVLKGSYTKEKVLREGIATFEEIKELIEESIHEIIQRRRIMK